MTFTVEILYGLIPFDKAPNEEKLCLIIVS